MEKEELKKEINIFLRRFNQMGLIGLKRELNEKGFQFFDEELSAAVGSLFLDGKLLLTYWP